MIYVQWNGTKSILISFTVISLDEKTHRCPFSLFHSQPLEKRHLFCFFVTAACQNIADQIGHIILVCPESIRTLAKAPNHKSKLLASIIKLPIYGTFIYNVGARNTALSDSPECRYLYSSILGHYTTVNIAHCLEGLTTSIAVISGKNAPETFEKAEEYCNVLPSIEHIEIAGLWITAAAGKC